jgi:D-alanyl-D-alanine carboxypeptidase (penicillin-binding protein 5/6)
MRKVIIIVISILLFIPCNVKALDVALAPSAKSAILIEASTGEILFENNADEKLAPA